MITHHSSHILSPGYSELEILSSKNEDMYLYSIQLVSDDTPFRLKCPFTKKKRSLNISNMIEICDFTIMGNPIFVNFEGTKVNSNRTSISMFSEPIIISNTFTPILNKKGGGLKIKLFNPTSNIVKLYTKAILKTKNESFNSNKWYIFNTLCFTGEESVSISAARKSFYFNDETRIGRAIFLERREIFK